MITASKIYADQTKYGVNASLSDTEKVDYDQYLAQCRKTFSDMTPREYYDWDKKKQTDFSDQLIVNFVKGNLKNVEGYIDKNGDLKQAELIERLRIDITGAGVLGIALADDTVQEIQINDFKTIYVVRGGRSELYVDENGRPYQFVSDEELHSVIDRLIYSPSNTAPRMTKVNPLMNTRTAGKGYRVSTVNSSAITPDNKVGNDFPVTTCTIRKYAPSMLTFDDFERFGTMTAEMSDFLRLVGRADTRVVVVGPTSSGKTTLLNAVAWEVDPELRIILIQNPTEIMLYDRSGETGANMRNVLHWEAQDLGTDSADDPTTPTMANMIAHVLRNTPDVVIPGEVRTAAEFAQVDRVLKTGHRVLTTLHAYDGADAIARMSTELATKGGSIVDFASSLANSIDLVVSCRKLGDGSRHVMAIEELTGELDDKGMAVTRVIFRFRMTGKVDKDPDTGKLLKIHGYYEQVNPISDALVEKFFSAGISSDMIDNYTKEVKSLKGMSNLPSQLTKKQQLEHLGKVYDVYLESDDDEDGLSFL